jgi:Tfp pilus assembly protein PilF
LETLKTIRDLGWVAFLQGKQPEAEALLRQSLDGQRRTLGSQHRETLSSMNNLASLYYEEGKYAQAEALHKETLDIRRRVLGAAHPDTWIP